MFKRNLKPISILAIVVLSVFSSSFLTPMVLGQNTGTMSYAVCVNASCDDCLVYNSLGECICEKLSLGTSLSACVYESVGSDCEQDGVTESNCGAGTFWTCNQTLNGDCSFSGCHCPSSGGMNAAASTRYGTCSE